MSETLKPCPFCGGDAEYTLNRLHGDNSMATCKQCGATAYWLKWNRRADEPHLAEVIKQRDEARTLVAEANNSLYGSHGYFHSTNGGPFDKHHLSRPIEDLKRQCNEQWRRAEAAEKGYRTT